MTKGICRWTGPMYAIIALFLASALSLSAQAQPPEPPGGFGFSLQLHAGWNMISSPIRSVPLTSIQGDCLVSNGPWWWSGTRYELTTTIEPAKGYWVKVGSPCTMQALTLTRNFPQTLALVPGWNLISSSGSWNQMDAGSCKLLSGPWWYDGTQYQQIAPDVPLDGFKGYWVKVDESCVVTSQALHGSQGFAPTRNDWLLPPGPPAFVGARHALPLLQDVRVTFGQPGRLDLELRGVGIQSSELRLYSLAGQLVAQARGSGSRLSMRALGRDGRPLANGVYLYLVIIQGVNGQTTSSEVRKVLIMR